MNDADLDALERQIRESRQELQSALQEQAAPLVRTGLLLIKAKQTLSQRLWSELRDLFDAETEIGNAAFLMRLARMSPENMENWYLKKILAIVKKMHELNELRRSQ